MRVKGNGWPVNMNIVLTEIAIMKSLLLPVKSSMDLVETNSDVFHESTIEEAQES